MTDDLQDLIDGLENALLAAFIAAMLLLRSGINYSLLVEALRARDVDAAILALNLDRGAFSGYLLERQTAFVKVGSAVSERVGLDRIAFFKKRDGETRGPVVRPSGVPTSRQPAPPVLRVPDAPAARAPDDGFPRARLPEPLPAPAPSPASPGSTTPPGSPPPELPTLTAPGGGRIEFRFDMTNPRAESKIRTEAAARVAGYVDEQIETARRVIADGFQRGEGPVTIATDIAGRINPISGRREGGIVGLSDPQVDYVENMRRRLLSSDPDEMVKVLGRFDKDGKWIEGTGQTLRDRRFDAAIKRAIRDVAAGKPNPLTGDKIDEMTAKYADRLLRRRAEDIARTETAQGVEMARAEATKQALDKSGLPDDALTKTWIHSGDPRNARDGHLAMNGHTVTGVDTPFILPDGSVMLYPHDPDGGVKNNANCRCRGDQLIDWAFGL